MSNPREGPNPLRPYYVPRTGGLTPDHASTYTATSNGINKTTGSSPLPSSSAPKASLSSSARDLFSDLDYSEYLSDSSPSAAEVTKRLLGQAIWKYTSVLIAQPFEVAKTILQVHLATGDDTRLLGGRAQNRSHGYVSNDYDSDVPSEQSDSDPDEPAYFTSTTPNNHVPSVRQHARRNRGRQRPRSLTPPSSSSAYQASSSSMATSPHKITLHNPSSLMEAISQLWSKEGAFGVWKGANTTFVYSVLLKTIESWTRSLLAAVFNVPDPGLLSGGTDIMDSPSPLASLGVAVAASGIAGILLAPLDIVRTQLILTPTTHPPRALLTSLRSLPSLFCPPSLLPITFLNSTLPNLLTTSTPLILRSRLGVDPLLTPTAYSFFTFTSAAVELCIRLPLETVLRRGQIAAVIQASEGSSPSAAATSSRQPRKKPKRKVETVVDVGAYKGVIGTMWEIVHYEGSSPSSSASETEADGVQTARRSKAQRGDLTAGKERKGQGLEGLFRGWRVGMWGLVGIWGAAALGGVGGKDGEF